VVSPTWDSFWDAIKEQYYPVGSYEDQYTRWTTLRQERDQTVPDFTNIFHTLHTKLGIKDSEQHLVLKYHGCLHRYIQTEMDFWTSPHWVRLIDTLSRSSINLSRRGESLDLQTPHSRSREKAAPTHTARDREKMATLRTTSPSHNTRREMRRRRRTRENGVSTIKSLGTTLKNVAPSSHSWRAEGFRVRGRF
jgi:hypothetical protein